MAKDIESKLHNRRVRMRDMQKRHLATIEPVQDTVPGTVFSINGSIVPERGSRYVWVHEWGAQASQQQALLPYGMSVFDGAGVIMQRAPKAPYQYEIIRLNTSPYPGAVGEDSDIGRSSLEPHGENHQYPTEATKGPDPVLVWGAGLQVLKAVASETDMKVVVGPATYYDDLTRHWFPTQEIDLTAHIPAAGNAVHVLVYLDIAMKMIETISSAEVVKPILPDFPDIPENTVPSAYFYIEDTDTVLDMETDYVDARPFITLQGLGLTIIPTVPNQQLFSGSDLKWKTGKIVTSSGDVVVSGGDVVWSPT